MRRCKRVRKVEQPWLTKHSTCKTRTEVKLPCVRWLPQNKQMRIVTGTLLHFLQGIHQPAPYQEIATHLDILGCKVTVMRRRPHRVVCQLSKKRLGNTGTSLTLTDQGQKTKAAASQLGSDGLCVTHWVGNRRLSNQRGT
jgi:hypothetical protein